MKKYILLFLIVFLVGCNLNNNPNSKVEEFLGNYQRLDKSINIDTSILAYGNVSNDLDKRYRKIIEKQYRNMSYELKDEKIDGDSAVVTTRIKVMDFKSVLEKYSSNNYSSDEYNRIIVDNLEKVKDKVTYTIYFNLTKDKDGIWSVNNLTVQDINKLIGIY